MVYGGGEGGESGNEGGSSVSYGNMYNRSVELVLVPLSDLYSLLKSILVGASRPSFYPTSHCLLTIQPTNYCSNQICI